MVFKEVPFLLLMTMAALNQIDVRRTVWVGRSLGFQRFAGVDAADYSAALSNAEAAGSDRSGLFIVGG